MATAKPFPSDEADKYVVRLPGGMRDKISREAKLANRSMNAEIVARLEASFVFIDHSAQLTQLSTALKAAERELELGERALLAQRDISELKSELLHTIATRLARLEADDDLTRLALRASQAKSTRDVADAFARLWELRHGLEPGTLDRLIPIDGAGVAPEPVKRKSSASKK